MCRVLQIAKAGFYFWLHQPLSDRDLEDLRLLTLIKHLMLRVAAFMDTNASA